MHPDEEPRLLLVEDSRDDVDLALLAFRMNGFPVAIDVARDGAEALDYLFSTGEHSGRPLPSPSLVLLDLKLPRVDGLEVLRRLRSDPRTQGIPVVVLTSSAEERDLRDTARIGIERYIRKPVDFSEFRQTAQLLAETWLRPGSGRTGVSA
ncbi:MAG TPA: response regulator [Planctomycetota bacterium]|nr:response regulator [Planctomycetota bacterium]